MTGPEQHEAVNGLHHLGRDIVTTSTVSGGLLAWLNFDRTYDVATKIVQFLIVCTWLGYMVFRLLKAKADWEATKGRRSPSSDNHDNL